jgi:hypothetical protein
MEFIHASAAKVILNALETLVDSHGYTSYVSEDEKEADRDVVAARKAIALAHFLGLGNGSSKCEPDPFDSTKGSEQKYEINSNPLGSVPIAVNNPGIGKS